MPALSCALAVASSSSTRQALSMADDVPPHDPIAAESVSSEDADSALGISLNESLTSLNESIYNYQIENGRRYHALSRGKYMLPNDDQELDRLDLQNHLFMLTLNGRLCLSPNGDSANRVLDLGTGSGIWAMEYADMHPQAEVIGVDLAPNMPDAVPPNCSFEIDDLEKDWTWHKKFDLIFSRMMVGSFSSYPSIIAKAFDALEPGGYLELQDNHFPVRSDDGSLTPDSPLLEWTQLIVKAAEFMGRPIDTANQYKRLLTEAGFEDVQEHVFFWPTNRWPRDPTYKELGTWTLANIDGGLEGLSMALFTRGLGWTKEQTINFCIGVRRELRNPRVHGYFPIYVVYGRKPAGK